MGKCRIFFATDLHGSEVCFRKFLNSWNVYEVNVLILGGDVTGKIVVPIFEDKGVYTAKTYGNVFEARDEKELAGIKRKIRDMSGYPILVSPEEKLKLDQNPDYVEELFDKLALETLEEWLQLAEVRLKGTGVKMYVTGGNDDPIGIGAVIDKHESDVIANADERVLSLPSGHEMISLGYSNPTPWHLPRDLTEDELAKKVENVAVKVKNTRTAIFNLHVPPYNTPPLDYAPELDSTLRPKMEAGGQFKMVPVGSVAIRKAIEQFQPLLGLHGHIHEAKGAVYVNRTLCINPGSEYGEGILRGVIVEIRDDKKPSYMFTSG
jgi:Icc-related predicted phosphoesterase